MSEKVPRLLSPQEIEVRVAQYIEGKGASLLLYKTARVDMDILDETYGAENWTNDYKEIKGNLYCGIAVNGIWKWDCGVESNTEAQKGEASDAFKRAGFRWGIGRELYSSPFIWVPEEKFEIKINKGKKVPKDKFVVWNIEYNNDRKISFLEVKNYNSQEVVFRYGRKQEKEKPMQKTAVCADCGRTILDTYIAEGTLKAYGRHLCKECGVKAKRAKQNESHQN